MKELHNNFFYLKPNDDHQNTDIFPTKESIFFPLSGIDYRRKVHPEDNVRNYIFVFILWVRLMCALRAHINKFIFEKILLKIEKVIKTFSISDNFFSKLIYYCVPLNTH